MRYNLANGKNVNIPDEEIENNMKVLDLTKEEAIQVWLEDNEYEVNEEQEALCKKAKDNRITATIHDAKDVDTPKKRNVAKKENPTKENLIAGLAGFLATNAAIANIKIENVGKIITFDLDGNSYKLDLIQKRVKKG